MNNIIVTDFTFFSLDKFRRDVESAKTEEYINITIHIGLPKFSESKLIL